jgi:hypothetical protein
MDYDTFTFKPDQEHIDLVDLASSIYKNYDDQTDDAGMTYDYGDDNYNWSDRSNEVSDDEIRVLLVCFIIVSTFESGMAFLRFGICYGQKHRHPMLFYLENFRIVCHPTNMLLSVCLSRPV